jgi:acyl-CoA thioesterase
MPVTPPDVSAAGPSPFAEWFGLRIVRAEQASAEVRLLVLPHHLNKFGNAHGGVCLSLADHACGALLSAIAADEFYATVTLTSAFFAPLATGEAIATATLASRSRRLAHIEASILQQDKLLFKASGTFAIRPKR